MELIAQKKKIPGDLSVFFYVNQWNALGTQDMLETEPLFATDVNDNIETAWIVHPKAGDPVYAKSADYLDTGLYFSPLKAIHGIWPAVDPRYCFSKALDAKVVGKEHYQVAKEVLAVIDLCTWKTKNISTC